MPDEDAESACTEPRLRTWTKVADMEGMSLTKSFRGHTIATPTKRLGTRQEARYSTSLTGWRGHNGSSEHWNSRVPVREPAPPKAPTDAADALERTSSCEVEDDDDGSGLCIPTSLCSRRLSSVRIRTRNCAAPIKPARPLRRPSWQGRADGSVHGHLQRDLTVRPSIGSRQRMPRQRRSPVQATTR